jgi:hypothetical protein
MFFAFGGRALGKVEACGDTYVVTTFACINFLPLVPTGSVLVAGGRSIPIRLHATSVVAAYLRAWAMVGLGWTLIGAVFAHGVGAHLVGLVVALPFALVALFAFRRLGVLTRTERAQREVYAPYFEFSAVDVALLGAEADVLHAKLLADVTERAQGQLGGTYRSVLDPATQWDAIALAPGPADPDFVRATFTLARLEEARAARAGDAGLRRRWRDAHRALWQKLLETDRHLIE